MKGDQHSGTISQLSFQQKSNIHSSDTIKHQGGKNNHYANLKRQRQEEEEQEKSNDMIVKECLLHHFYSEGHFDLGDCLVREAGMSDDKMLLKGPYLELVHLLNDIRGGSVEATLEWATVNCEILGEMGLRLRFDLVRLKYTQLILSGRAKDALTYAREHFAPFANIYNPEIQKLTGCLAFANRLEMSPYSAYFELEKVQSSAVRSLSVAYCKAMKIPQESAFAQCVRLGTASLPKINRVMALMKERKGVEWTQQDELPVELDLSDDLRHHSIFVCPILKQQATEDNPPMMLPCGHVICKEALTRLSKGQSVYRFKCPYCPVESNANSSQQVYF